MVLGREELDYSALNVVIGYIVMPLTKIRSEKKISFERMIMDLVLLELVDVPVGYVLEKYLQL